MIITHSQYYDVLPECMKSRVVVVNLENANWFKNAINSAKLISKKKFIPTNEALHMFDQNNTFGEMYKCIFND